VLAEGGWPRTSLVLITLLLFVIGLCQGAFLVLTLITPYVTK
jgi:hypothetical protein